MRCATTPQAAFGKVPARELVPACRLRRAAARWAKRGSRWRSTDAKVPLFMRVYRVPSYAEAAPGQAEALETLAQILGGDLTGSLYRKLVVEKHLATNVGASYDGYARDDGEFQLYAMPRPGVSLAALERRSIRLSRARSRPHPMPSDLARAKTQLVASATYRRDSQFAMASAYGQALSIGLTAFDVKAWPDRIQAVTASRCARPRATSSSRRRR